MLAHGFSAWGVDASAALVQRARERLPNAEFVCASVLDVALPDGSAAAAIGEVLNYATADQPNGLARVFARIFAALTPGGVFLFDLAGPGRGGVRRTFFEGDGWAVGMNASERDDLLVRKITTFRKTECGDWRRSFEEHRLRLWSAPEVTAQLVAAGFRVELLDDYRGSNMPPALQAYLARKPS
jgi:SAM-dependent methyltransferase